MFNPFIQFGLIILVVLGVSILMRLLKQPLIIGYILSGILVGPFVLNLIQESATLNVFSEMGIAFLLFIVGLHLSPKVLKQVGKISLITGIGQILFTSLIGYFIGILLGFSPLTSLYIAIALTFSSTIIIMKLLSDKGALEKLYGKISIGFLLVQDLVAILILIVVSSLSNGGGAGNVIFSTVLKGVILIGVLIPVSRYVLPKLSNFFAKSQEFLFIFAVSWGFGLSLLFIYIGFSIEVGALIAGVMLSMSPYSYEISSKMKPLRDFFIISFFIILGGQMAFGDITSLILPAVVLSLFILIGNPLIVMTLMGLLGYSKKTGFMAGLTVAQISEFSLILIALGVSVGHLSLELLSVVTTIGLITIAGSTYMILYSNKIYSWISPYLDIFEKAFILFELRGYSRNLRTEIRKKSKYYFLDNGIRNALINNFNDISVRNDIGILWENFCVIERMKYQSYTPLYANNYFWRTWDQKEVDWIEEREGKIYGYEFTYSGKKKSPKTWLETYKEATFTVINRENYLPFITKN